MRYLLVAGLTVLAAPAAAQLSVTTIGATDAAACYQNARSDFSSDIRPCDDALDDAATTRGDRKKTLVNRGIIHNRNGDIADAIDDFNAALAIDSDLGEAYLNRGNSYFLAGRYDDALADYRRSLELDFSEPWAAWYNIGLVYDAKKQPDEARAAYEQALAEKPDFAEAKQKLERER